VTSSEFKTGADIFRVMSEKSLRMSASVTPTTLAALSLSLYRQKKWQYSIGLGGAVKAMPRVSGS
jgi:hypothetical protein